MTEQAVAEPTPPGRPASTRVRFSIRRQDGPETPSYWQDFALDGVADLNVSAALLRLREQPLTLAGERVAPVVWERSCLEEVCGSCTLLINGVPRPACSARVSELTQPIRLEPLPKFPVIRDLLVDRSGIDAGLRRVKAWIELDGSWDTHDPAPRISPQAWRETYLYSRCMSCGACMAACPQFGPDTAFVGPAALAQVRLHNAHPTGRFTAQERLHAIMAEGGLSDCGNAQNCVRVCPKGIPLTTAIGELGRQTTLQALRDLFG